MMAAGIHNLPLTKYLIDQVRLTPEARIKALQEYFPEARMEDWELEIAGQRVQGLADFLRKESDASRRAARSAKEQAEAEARRKSGQYTSPA